MQFRLHCSVLKDRVVSFCTRPSRGGPGPTAPGRIPTGRARVRRTRSARSTSTFASRAGPAVPLWQLAPQGGPPLPRGWGTRCPDAGVMVISARLVRLAVVPTLADLRRSAQVSLSLESDCRFGLLAAPRRAARSRLPGSAWPNRSRSNRSCASLAIAVTCRTFALASGPALPACLAAGRCWRQARAWHRFAILRKSRVPGLSFLGGAGGVSAGCMRAYARGLRAPASGVGV